MRLFLLIIIFVIVISLRLFLKSPKGKGQRSEQAVALKLEADSFRKHGGKVLTNIYVPKPAGDTAEIDVLYITNKGLIVLENKNYAGYIFGSESNKSWTVTLYAGKTWYGSKKSKKYKFYNPIWQNRTHIKYLKRYLCSDFKTFSLITFSDRGELKDITYDSPDVFVCNHASLYSVIRKIWNENPDVLSEIQIYEIYSKLLPLANPDDEVRQRHTQTIQQRLSDTDTCPACGGQLILRTARKGPNSGSQFYGCSNYPKCKYTRNV
ncbi:MAG: NERD domain-containing protein [Firmicutes bacterium]|nr:NERD domain-containing protein [Bacillota bacterium]